MPSQFSIDIIALKVCVPVNEIMDVFPRMDYPLT